MTRRSNVRLTKTRIDQAPFGGTIWDAEVSGFGVRSTPTGVRTFILQYRTHQGDQGKLKLGRFPAMTVEEARKLAREHRVSIDKGGNPSRDRRDSRASPTLDDYASNYCDVYGPQRGLKPNTIAEARRVLIRYALPRFGRRKIADVSTADVRAMIAAARDGSGAGQANRLRAVLSKIFNLAIADDVRIGNPCEGVEKYPENARSEFLPPEHVRQLLNACDAYHDQESANVVRLLLFTGARKNEVLKAEWGQFDLYKGFWTKPSSHTKTKRVHRLALEPETVSILLRMRSERSSDFLFPGADGLKPRHDIKRHWARILKASDIGHYRLHDLRRTTASFMLSTQSDLATVGKALGHTQAQTTMRYANLFQNVQRDGSERAVQAMLGG
ncbi:tyrosine-type recombinase/integrase [Brevundimonas vesicularis]|uniref:tyrosine-type recombinase/integrase n=1 Tax=Brevundimonas vesicularis TaxID=41276 RepID=UPI0038D50EAB